jgi:uncharacterized protein (TIGR03000 family)
MGGGMGGGARMGGMSGGMSGARMGSMGAPAMGSTNRGGSPTASGANYRWNGNWNGNRSGNWNGANNRNWWYNRNYYPYYWRGYYYPYWLTFGLGLGFWGFWPSYYGPSLGYIDPALFWDYSQPYYSMHTYPPPPDGQFYPPPPGMDQVSPPQPDYTVHISVIVPPDAEVWFDQEKTTQSGTVREFESPPIQPGRFFSYDVKAKWPEGGKNVEFVRHITVRAGDRTTVDFSRPDGGERLNMPRPIN